MARSCATSCLHSPHLVGILARKLLERSWFPSVYRPGFHTIRPDSHWFLEQWFPFDYSNQSTDEDIDQPDLADGRFGDWRPPPPTAVPVGAKADMVGADEFQDMIHMPQVIIQRRFLGVVALQDFGARGRDRFVPLRARRHGGEFCRRRPNVRYGCPGVGC